ncbi:unnamed protein product [Fraxinus pennsylvanica]|uniref:PPM-type phosphatase domain-containing protein n=1 Tax=Fraxinus pennsylvanica TaxID=56036 RepID=A0AAD2E0F0_9LAMI|nr:unnamed protein product [Fraxinus pennsylvanica]
MTEPRGQRELALFGGKMDQLGGDLEGLIQSPKSGEFNSQIDDWTSEEEALSDYNGPSDGCTACVAIVRNNQLLVANAGDSRCVLSRRGHVKFSFTFRREKSESTIDKCIWGEKYLRTVQRLRRQWTP